MIIGPLPYAAFRDEMDSFSFVLLQRSRTRSWKRHTQIYTVEYICIYIDSHTFGEQAKQ